MTRRTAASARFELLPCAQEVCQYRRITTLVGQNDAPAPAIAPARGLFSTGSHTHFARTIDWACSGGCRPLNFALLRIFLLFDHAFPIFLLLFNPLRYYCWASL